MRRTLVGMAIGAMCTSAEAELTGFVQLRQSERTGSVPASAQVEARGTMVQQLEAELLYEHRLDNLTAAGRLVTGYDSAISSELSTIREAYVDWAASSMWNFRAGRQVMTWGVSDYLYVNDIFPKNFDAFFSGAVFDRLKEPVDALRALTYVADSTELEVVISRSRSDRTPGAARFTGAHVMLGSVEQRDSDSPDIAARASRHVSGWDLAGYVASFRSREARHYLTPGGLAHDYPRLDHLGVSASSNFASGVLWVEAAVRKGSERQERVVSRYYLGSSARSIVGYSREVGPDFTATVQLQLEAPLNRDRYRGNLAAGVRSVSTVAGMLYLRLDRRWANQTRQLGVQAFLGDEGDSHVNPFMSWSPFDGLTLEAGGHLFSGQFDTRFGNVEHDSNIYALSRYSF